ncbi:hypothetical protein [Paraburkholderia sp. BL10I2N1]|uniref:hypothetical protein n=1 Tax=Paraburkholderia sp. BL10I2N1 TaxID=1938796 RepID=UPI001414E4E2|nr:hypothetical protein [Paraburkholderia sp. BL10I2N1]
MTVKRLPRVPKASAPLDRLDKCFPAQPTAPAIQHVNNGGDDLVVPRRSPVKSRAIPLVMQTCLDAVPASLSRSIDRVSTRKRWRVHFVELVIDFNARSVLNPRMPLQDKRTETEAFIWLSSSISNNPSTIIWALDDSSISQKGGQLR